MSKSIKILFGYNFLVGACLLVASISAQAQSTNDLVQIWLKQHGKVAILGDYSTCQTDSQPDGVCSWNAAALGTQPTPTQLASLVSIWQTQQGAAKQYAMVLATGSVAVTSTSTPSLSGTYGIALNDKIDASAVTAGIAAGQGLPGSESTFVYFDVAHQPHSFTSDQWLVFAKALRDYVYNLALAATGQGTVPATPITIP